MHRSTHARFRGGWACRVPKPFKADFRHQTSDISRGVTPEKNEETAFSRGVTPEKKEETDFSRGVTPERTEEKVSACGWSRTTASDL